jgi:hypothetical protein
MSRTLKKFWKDWVSIERLLDKLAGRSFHPGARILPFSKNDDSKAELRIDAGEKVGDMQKVILQVNSQAKSPALVAWRAKNGRQTHGQPATGSFDTKAKDLQAETRRLLEDLDTQAKAKLG